jgi:peroxiredoxin
MSQRPQPTPRTDAPAPELTLPDADGRPVTLSDFRGRNVVIAFYPADWTPVCTSELALFEETLDELRDRNAQILAISTDTPYSHRAWASHQRLSFPLLSDFWPHGDVARMYGVFRDDDGLCHRSLFFIDPEGVLRDRWIADDQDVAPGLNLVFDTLDQMQARSGGPPPPASTEEPRHAR